MHFGELIKRISPTLKRITYRLNGHYSFFNDEDLYQEALVHLWQDFCAGKLNGKTDSYILQGCYFYLKNYLRKAKDRTGLFSLEGLIDEEGMNLEESLCLKNRSSCFDDLENKLLIAEIRNNGLTKREKEVLNLCLDGLVVREIGRRLGVSHVRVVKIKKGLRKKLKQFF